MVDLLLENQSEPEGDRTKICKDMTLSEFIKVWRREFIDVMKPQNMPVGWTIDQITLRTFGKKSKFYEVEENGKE